MQKVLIANSLDITLERLSQWILPAEFEYAQRYQSEERQKQHLIARGLIRWALRNELANSGQIEIKRTENGAPQLRVDGQSWYCSISHTANTVMVAISLDQALTVDVEALPDHDTTARQQRITQRFAKGFFRDVDAQDRIAFYQRWTLAEAVTKYQQGLLMRTLKSDPTPYLKHAQSFVESTFVANVYNENVESHSPIDLIRFTLS